MLENILKLEGVHKLSNGEQKTIKGNGIIRGGGNDIIACICPGTGNVVVGHADSCEILTKLLCPQDS
ncbi:hypothetical protein [Flavobacterium microcysteis]|jgi:hypothetical protein|uniref:Uncharacterized protein n=1 Tax=Flavobacterium microcysteis TaxID=2596891 RepID=A0A501Q7S3_9FLAO|nr:hypothetical protein [Flavobacterium microcysteis]TPD68372.1 hypothetical protein FJA49_09920 [Flavobacterium microcysteis]